MDLSVTDAIVVFLILLVSLSVHEWAHAWTALKLGDPTARSMGRVTFNPIPHIDPIGTVFLPALILLSGSGFFFAWAKPVPVNPSNFSKPVRDDILVSMAGPFSNLVICLVVAVVFGLIVRLTGSTDLVPLAGQFILINAMLMIFNLIPIPPLDGSHVLRHLVGMSEVTYMKFAQFGFFIIIGLLFLTPLPGILQALIQRVSGAAFRIMQVVAGG